MDKNYKIVPAVERSDDEIIRSLRQHLASNVDVSIADGDLPRAALFQEYLDVFERLVGAAGSPCAG